MVVLALDTTTRGGSCALMRDGRLVCERAGDPAREQGERLPRDLARVLAEDGTTLEQVGLLAVATGPGSFTGLRVGIATMQGLAVATGVPLIGIPSFDALAHIGSKDERARGSQIQIATWVDAWRGEVFAALYSGGRATEAPLVAKPAALLAALGSTRTLFVGDGAQLYLDTIRDTRGSRAEFASPLAPLLAGAVAALANTAYQQGLRPPPHAVRPVYVRRSDAELARQTRAG
jgi:tRNA threonylcarbamoyladenosine biosynthesis protein TsaB